MIAYFETSSTLAKSTIGALTSSIMASTSKIDELVSAIAADSSELQDATAIREKEAADFAKKKRGQETVLSMATRPVCFSVCTTQGVPEIPV